MNLAVKTLLLAGALAACAAPQAGTLTLSGSLGSADPVFDHPFDDAAALTHFTTYEIAFDADGLYEFLTFYPGDVNGAQHLNGYLGLYDGTFDPAAAINVTAFSDDYDYALDGALTLIDEPRCSGSNCSAFQAQLLAGTTYTILVGAFSDLPGPLGQPVGEFSLTASGPGIYPFPLPAAVWLMFSGLAGLGFLRR